MASKSLCTITELPEILPDDCEKPTTFLRSYYLPSPVDLFQNHKLKILVFLLLFFIFVVILSFYSMDSSGETKIKLPSCKCKQNK